MIGKSNCFFLVFCLVVCVVGCKSKPQKESESNRVKAEDSSTAFIKSLIVNELIETQKTPYFIYCTRQKTNLPQDSNSISKEALANYFTPLLNLDIYRKGFTENFNETTFEDLTTENISIIYTPKPKASVSTQNVTILLNNKTNLLNNFIAKTITENNDTIIYTQYFLKAKKSLTISSQAFYNNKEQYQTKMFINWNDY
jgi:hypothetical protein